MDKKWIYRGTFTLMLVFALIKIQAQALSPFKISFANPTVPGTLHITNHRGNVHIEGYSGKEVLIQAETKAPDSKQSYQSFLPQTPFLVREENNKIYLEARPEALPLNFRIKVPTKTTLKLSLEQGDVFTSQTSRLVEIVNQQGSVTLEQLSGWAVVNTTEGNIQADFAEVIANKTMSFVSLSGDISLDFPKDLEADFKIKSVSGEIENAFGQAALQPKSQLDQQMANVFRADELTQRETGARERKASNKKEQAPDTEAVQKQEYNRALGEEKKPAQEPSGTYQAPQSYTSKANQGGPLFFISTRQGKVAITHSKKPKSYR